MTEPKQTDMQSLYIQGAHREGLRIAEILAARAQNHVGALAVSEAQKAMAEKARDSLKDCWRRRRRFPFFFSSRSKTPYQ